MIRHSVAAVLAVMALGGGNRAVLTVVGMMASFVAAAMTQADLQGLIDAAEEDATVEVAENVTISSPLAISKSVTLTSPAGVTNVITRTGGTVFFSLSPEAPTVTLRNLICDGNASGGSTGRFIQNTNGTFVVSAGATVRNFENGGNYGAILLQGTARFVLEEDGVLSTFTNKRYAPCVDLEKGSVFDMTGGVITNCYGRYEGGDYGYDGAVYVYGGTFNMSGGKIVGNGSASSTAGVDLYEGSFNMSGGEISGNSGGVGGFYAANGIARLSGGLITGNTGTYAGGVYMKQGNLYLSGDATITNNVGGTVNDLFLADDTIYYNNDGRNPYAIGYISTNYTGFATVYATYEPKDSAISSAPFESWIKNFFIDPGASFPSLGRISCQNYPPFIFHGSYSADKWIYWGKPVCKVNGVPYVKQGDTMEALKGEFADVELCRDVTWASTFVPSSAAKSVLLHSPVGTNYTMTVNGASQVVGTSYSNTTLRLENIVISASTNAPHVANVSHGRLELGAGAVLEKGLKGVHMIYDDATVVMEEGSVIRDAFSPSGTTFGFAVQIGQYLDETKRHSNPTFIMTGGLITNCVGGTSAAYPASSGYGGAVYVYGGEFRMTGGKIAGNICTNSSAGVMHYDGVARFSGDAVIENNVGETPDLYIYGNRTAYFFGDFRGHVGVSSGSQAAGSTFKVKPEAGATGAWSFFAAANATTARLIGAGQGEGASIVWAAPAGTVDGVEVATAGDASFLVPKTLDVGEAGRAALPHLFTGVAAGVTGEVALEGCDFGELKAAGLLPLTLFSCPDGAFTGKVKFVLPEDCRDKLVAKRRGDKYVLDEKQGIIVLLR